MKKTLRDFQIITEALLSDEKSKPVVDFIAPTQLAKKIDLSLSAEPIDEDDHFQKLKEIILASTRTATTGFFNQLYGGRNETAVLGELLAVLLNNSMYTFKAAGIQIGIEKTILREVCNLLGWSNTADGTFPTGGSMSNLMSMILARDAYNENIRFEGIADKLTVYTSTESHYSVIKNAAFTGIGRNNVHLIPADKFGRMLPNELEKEITQDLANGFHPIIVNATAGTTVLGAFDPVKEVSEICKKHKVWLHVDGAYGGAIIFSPKYKHLIEGVENADSFSFNAHKMFGTPLTCSIFVVKDKKHLFNSMSTEANYLFQTEEDDYNLGKTSLQCGRRNDALKFWTLWKRVGTNGLADMINHEFALADFARDYVKNNKDYELVSFNDSISVCFNYKGLSAKELCTELYHHAQLLVSFGSFNEKDFIRLVTINGQNSTNEILSFFKTLEKFVEEKNGAK